jgi:hypothetical protein
LGQGGWGGRAALVASSRMPPYYLILWLLSWRDTCAAQPATHLLVQLGTAVGALEPGNATRCTDGMG